MFLHFIYIIVATSVKASVCKTGQHCSSCNTLTGECEDDCHTGYFGRTCSYPCSQGCKNKACSSSSRGIEVCTDGCKPGFYGDTCRAPCMPTGGCNRCSKNCQDGFCNDNISCFSGCHHSYYGTDCLPCASSCKVCNRLTGECEECAPNYGGVNCTQSCVNCLGRCGSVCYDVCKSRFFGEFCEKTCPPNCESGCDRKNGRCSHCKSGWFGQTCQNQCSAGCLDETCHIEGECKNGCKKGYHGGKCSMLTSCERECVDKGCGYLLCTYCPQEGLLCRERCNSCFETCEMHMGQCTRICPDYNKTCTETCKHICLKSDCDILNACQVLAETTLAARETSKTHNDMRTTKNFVPYLMAAVGILVVIIIGPLVYFSCHFKCIRSLIYENVLLRRRQSTQESQVSPPPVAVYSGHLEINEDDD